MASEVTFDAIVVGSGMSGGWAAKELCEKGLKTLVVERGKQTEAGADYVGEFKKPWDYEFRDQVNPTLKKTDYSVQSKCYAFRESTRNFFINDRENPYSTAEGKPFTWIRGDQVGGKSLMWARQSYRWSDIDFEANKRDGNGNDWPIRYQDVEPWYDYVEKFVGISGSAEGLPQLPDSIFQPPMDMTCVEKTAKEKIEKEFPNRNLIIGRAAHLTQPTKEQLELGRGACQFRHQCERGCSFGGYFSSVSATLPAAKRTGNLSLLTDSIVEKILYDPSTKRASGIQIIDKKSKEKKQIFAKVIFLCASTAGTLQILLNSKSDTFPNGFANTSGVLGKYIMDHHHRVRASGTMRGFEDKYFIGRRPNGIYVPRYRNLRNETGGKYLRGYAYQGSSSRPSWERGEREKGFGKAFKESLRNPAPWTFHLSGFGEMLPHSKNQIRLHSSKRDAYGMPLVHFDIDWSDNEKRMREDMLIDAVKMLEAAGCEDIQSYNGEPVPGHAIHEMGGARMGADPSDSVLNNYNQCHDVENVFVTDGAAFASVACQNPSLTFMALTARAVDFAVSKLKEGSL